MATGHIVAHLIQRNGKSGGNLVIKQGLSTLSMGRTSQFHVCGLHVSCMLLLLPFLYCSVHVVCVYQQQEEVILQILHYHFLIFIYITCFPLIYFNILMWIVQLLNWRSDYLSIQWAYNTFTLHSPLAVRVTPVSVALAWCCCFSLLQDLQLNTLINYLSTATTVNINYPH